MIKPNVFSASDEFLRWYSENGFSNMPLHLIWDAAIEHCESGFKNDLERILQLIKYRNGYELELFAKDKLSYLKISRKTRTSYEKHKKRVK